MTSPAGAVLRPAGTADALVLSALHEACVAGDGSETWDGASIAALLSTPGTSALIAVEGDAPVGLLIDRIAGGECEILTIAVLPGYRRRGYGAALLKEVLRRSTECGAHAVILEVGARNRAALALYRAKAFRTVGRRRGYYRHDVGPEDALILRHDLQSSAGRRIGDARPD